MKKMRRFSLWRAVGRAIVPKRLAWANRSNGEVRALSPLLVITDIARSRYVLSPIELFLLLDGNLTDIEGHYKVFRRQVLEFAKLEANFASRLQILDWRMNAMRQRLVAMKARVFYQ